MPRANGEAGVTAVRDIANLLLPGVRMRATRYGYIAGLLITDGELWCRLWDGKTERRTLLANQSDIDDMTYKTEFDARLAKVIPAREMSNAADPAAPEAGHHKDL